MAGMSFLVGLIAEVLEFYEKVIGPVDVAQMEEGGASFGGTSVVDEIPDLSMAACG